MCAHGRMRTLPSNVPSAPGRKTKRLGGVIDLDAAWYPKPLSRFTTKAAPAARCEAGKTTTSWQGYRTR